MNREMGQLRDNGEGVNMSLPCEAYVPATCSSEQ
jgi:hypothetical protein